MWCMIFKNEAILSAREGLKDRVMRVYEGEFYKRGVARSFVEVSRSYLARLPSYKL